MHILQICVKHLFRNTLNKNKMRRIFKMLNEVVNISHCFNGRACEAEYNHVFTLQVCFFVALYYNVIIGWSLFYFSQSFQQPLPWDQCPLVKNASHTCKQWTNIVYLYLNILVYKLMSFQDLQKTMLRNLLKYHNNLFSLLGLAYSEG